jgi:hypothetical protein
MKEPQFIRSILAGASDPQLFINYLSRFDKPYIFHGITSYTDATYTVKYHGNGGQRHSVPAWEPPDNRSMPGTRITPSSKDPGQVVRQPAHRAIPKVATESAGHGRRAPLLPLETGHRIAYT